LSVFRHSGPSREEHLGGEIVGFEISLCDKKNSKPHDVSEVEKERDSEPTHTGDNK